MAELVLVVGAPGEDVAVGVERENVVWPCAQVGDVVEVGDLDWCGLFWDQWSRGVVEVVGETVLAVLVLYDLVVSTQLARI